MDFLKAEIQRKRKATEELKREAVQGAAKPKFVRRGDLERVRTERVLAEERERRKQEEERKQRDAEELARQRERLERMTQAMSTKGNSSQGAAGANVASTDAPLAAGAVSVPGQGKPSASAASSAEGASEQHAAAGSAAGQAAAAAAGGADGAEAPLPKLPRTEVARRLRLHGEPITFFGESDEARLARLRRLEGEKDVGGAEEHGEEVRNVFVDRESRDAEGEDGERAGRKRRTVASVMEVRREENESAESYVYRFFKTLLREWAHDLEERPEHVKRSVQGKVATKTQKQCKDYMKPFFKLCERKGLQKQLLLHTVKMVDHCLQKEYVKANDEYLRLAIGNSPWPIGVTSVGIHQRTGREKIESNKIAHVMNDECQRKYVTSFRRLMTYCQRKYPTDPSKMCFA